MQLGTLLFVCAGAIAIGQNAASLQVHVSDPAGADVVGAQLSIVNALTGFQRTVLTAADGVGTFTNIPYEAYELTVECDGFQRASRTVALRSNLPTRVEVALSLVAQQDSVEVQERDDAVLVDEEATGTRMQLTASAIEHLPVPNGARGLEGVLLTFPGFAADANGAIHPRGAHNQMTYVVDGMPISDQLTGAFANAVDPSIVQSIELYTGNVPAEYGSKVSGVAVIGTPSGRDTGRFATGSMELGAAQFDTLSQVTRIAGERGRFGYFGAFNAVKSNRFLDQVSLENWHNGGNTERAFLRLDYQPGERDALRLNLMAGRSSFELANLRSQWLAEQDQRQLLRDYSLSLGWLRTLSPASTLDIAVSWRSSYADLFPSPGDTPVTAAQSRRLSTFNGGMRYNRQWHGHTVRLGGDFQRFPVWERFAFGITSPDFNAPGSPHYLESLAAFDLSRGGSLFRYHGTAAGALTSVFAQDNWKFGRWMISAGLRFDRYRFLSGGSQLQPRVGIAYHLRETGTVFRASYNRNFQTPPNENLLLSSSEEAGALVSPTVRAVLGHGSVAIRPERQNVYEAGVQQAVRSLGSLNASFYHKDSVDMQDNDNFFNTGIIFPTSLARARVNGAEARFAFAPVRGISGAVSVTHYHAVVTPPFTGGLFLGSTALDVLTAGPFVIDHDQELGVAGNVYWQARPWLSASAAIRYDSGLVSNPSDPETVKSDPDYAPLLPYVNLLSNPPRVRPRTIADMAIGYARIGSEGRKRWDLTFTLTNVANTTALYNFQSIFVGTRIVSPRTAGVRWRWLF